MLGYWQLFRGLLRYGLIVSYYNSLQTKTLSGMLCRIWGWLHNASKDHEVAECCEWKFGIGEEVQIGNAKHVGMIFYRWVRFGRKLYEIKRNKRHYVYYEWQLAKTNFRLYGEVRVQEIKFKSLREGHYCLPTKLPNLYYNYPMTYSNPSQVRVIKLR